MTVNNNFGVVGLSRPMSGYERPVPDDTATTARALPKRSGAAPMSGESQTTPIAKAAQAIENALTRFEDAWADIASAEGRGQLTADGRAALVAGADQSVAIDGAVAEAAARAEKAGTDYQAVRARLSPKSNSALDALEHDIFWRRISRELDSVPAERVVASTRRLIETATRPEFSWLSLELPSYLRSRGVPDSWLDAALQAANPELKAAAEQRRRAEQAAAIVSANGRSAKRALQSAASGSYRRPRLVPVDKYDPDSSG